MKTAEEIPAEPVRLLIWDLDDTFWAGTLTEGGVQLVERNLEIVRRLSERGIINSICSKNDKQRVQMALKRADIWDHFVFPRIAWEPKGAMVRSIIESAQLRPETVMFIDDNAINLNEVAHYNPGLQLADPEFLDKLLVDPRFKGKDDRALTRLAQYKVLERKQVDSAQFVDDSNRFLRHSEIQISFHTDVMSEFDRIYELINRTNQLNFTKNRLPEDKAAARAFFERELRAKPHIHTAYVKTSDKYGYYGIVGFYLSELVPGKGRCVKHFVFSCRTLNMGIEQFVHRKLNSPYIEVQGEVVSELRSNGPIDWISVVQDAERHASGALPQSPTLCIRGACELDQLAHYLGHKYPLKKEFAFPYEGWGIPVPAAQNFSLWDQLDRESHARLFSNLPGLHPACMDSCLRTGGADLFVLSFSMEPQWQHYRHRATGLVFPLKLEGTDGKQIDDLTQLSFSEVRSRTKLKLSEAQWEWFLENLQFCGAWDPERFARNMRDLCRYLEDKQAIFVLLNTQHGKRTRLHAINAEINAIVEQTTSGLSRQFISLDSLVMGEHEVIDAHHFRRDVYPRLAASIGAFADRMTLATADPAAVAP